MRKAALSIAVLFCFFPGMLTAADTAIIDDTFTVIPLSSYAEVFEDKTRSLTINEITTDTLSRQFVPVTKKTINFGYSKSAFWIRYSTLNSFKNDREYFLKIDNPLLNYIKFYQHDGTTYRETVMGDNLPFKSREIKDRNFIFPIVQKTGRSTFYIRIESHSNLVLPASLYSPKKLISDVDKDTIPLSIFLGIMIVMMMYNFFIFISLKDKTYIYFVLFILFFILYRMTTDGFGFQYLWPDNIWIQNTFSTAFIGICIVFLLLFNRSFLELKKNTGFMNKISLLLIISLLAVIAFFLTGITVLGFVISFFYIISSFITSILSGIICLFRGHRQARIYLLSWSLFLVTAFFYLMRNFNLIQPSFIVNWSIYIGMVFLVLFFSLALADKVNIISAENKRLYSDVKKFNEKLEIEISEKIKAEQTVLQQYEEIQSQYEEMDALNSELICSQKELLESNKELNDEKERLSTMLLSIGDGVIATDINGNIGLMNSVAEKLTGHKAAASTGKNIDDIFHLLNINTKEKIENPVFTALKSGEIAEVLNNTVLVSHELKELSITLSAAPMFDHANIINGTILVFRDISEKLQMETELQKSRTIESIGLLAGGIAHDFNNILTAILANISMAKANIEERKSVIDYMNESERAVFRARDLTQQLLTFSKGGAPLKKLASIVEILKDSISFALAGSNIKSKLLIAEGLRAAEIDEGQISQVLYNLIINAKQAMPDGGIITVTADNIVLDSGNLLNLKPGIYLKISIIDQGEGITPENAGKIFDPYFTTKKVGTGLGLTSSYSIVRKHEGSIDLKSEHGSGSTFTVYLPASDRTFIPPASAKPYIGKNTGRILVMDDEVSIVKVLVNMLTFLGYEVDTAANGEEAVEKYNSAFMQNKKYDIVIMDLTVPGGMGGEKTQKKLMEIDPQVKSIVSSGYSNDPVMAEYSKFGFIGVIFKPYILEDLNTAVSRLLIPEK